MRALIADDDRITTAILANALNSWGIETTTAHDGAQAWAILNAGAAPAIVIADWIMPGLDGIQLCQRIRQEPSLAGTYVMLLTAKSSRVDLVAGLDAGADDYMTKPIDTEELRARVQVGLRVATLQRRLSEKVSELEAARDNLARIASTDVLTELYSRRGWFEIAATEFSRSRRYNRAVSLMIVDLDYFKRVNDTYGHDAGDRLLQTFAALLRLECRQSDVVGRIGGEEFAVLLPETSVRSAQRLAGRIAAACRTLKVAAATGQVTCTCSIGISDLRPQDMSIDDAMRRADAALYEAKHAGRNCWKADALVAEYAVN
ncbi:MAG TPA: diguanylate cyclase [Vicinamibacterales bacterium]|nr:diguanylate cyclase [Vicinamibacterales bacterium]